MNEIIETKERMNERMYECCVYLSILSILGGA